MTPYEKQRQIVAENMRRAYGQTELIKALESDLVKGKRANIGEIREWGGKKFQKTAQGWVEVKETGRKGGLEQKEDFESKGEDLDSMVKEFYKNDGDIDFNEIYGEEDSMRMEVLLQEYKDDFLQKWNFDEDKFDGRSWLENFLKTIPRDQDKKKVVGGLLDALKQAKSGDLSYGGSVKKQFLPENKLKEQNESNFKLKDSKPTLKEEVKKEKDLTGPGTESENVNSERGKKIKALGKVLVTGTDAQLGAALKDLGYDPKLINFNKIKLSYSKDGKNLILKLG